MDATDDPLLDYLSKEGRLIKWLLDLAERKKKIEAFPNVSKCLDELRQAGADSDIVLTGVVLMYPGAAASTKRQFKALRVRLTNLADRLERISQEVEQFVSDPLTHSVCWRVLLVEKSTDFTATGKRLANARYLCNAFKVFVNFFRAEAKAFQELGRKYEAARTNDGLGPVLCYVKQSAGQFHDECMANLLQAAHDALGVEADFSAEMLRKLRQRKLPDVTRKRKKPNPSNGGLSGLYGMCLPLSKLDITGSKK